MKKPICPYIITDSSSQMQRTAAAHACYVVASVATIASIGGARVCHQLIATATAADDNIDGPMPSPCTKSYQCSSAARSCWRWCCWVAKTSLTSPVSPLSLSLC